VYLSTDDAELEVLKAAARQRLVEGQGVLDLDLDAVAGSGPLEIVSSRMGHLWDALCRAYDTLGFAAATGHDDVFRHLVLARIIEPTSKPDALRVLDEVGIAAPAYRTLKRPPARVCRAGVAAATRGVRGARCARTGIPRPV
jgi:hypothetical protein